MNAKDRAQIEKANALIAEARVIMEELAADLQARADNLADTNFQDRADKLAEESDQAAEITGNLEEAESATADLMES